VEISRLPKLALLQLLVVDDFIRERHDAEVSLCGEKSTLRLQEHISGDDVSLEHALVEQKGAQRLAHNHIYRLERDLCGVDVLYFALDDFDHVLKSICFDQGTCDLGCSTSFASVDFLCASLGSE